MLRLDHFASLKIARKERVSCVQVFIIDFFIDNLVPVNKKSVLENTIYTLPKEPKCSQVFLNIYNAIDFLFYKTKSLYEIPKLVADVLSLMATTHKVVPSLFDTKRKLLADKIYKDKEFYYIFSDSSFAKYFNTITSYTTNDLKENFIGFAWNFNDGRFKVCDISDLLVSKRSNLIPSMYLYK